MTADQENPTSISLPDASAVVVEVEPPTGDEGEGSGPLVALETGDGWVLGREGEDTIEHRKKAVFSDGSVRTYRNRPGTVRSVKPGSMLHRLVQSPEATKERMRQAPAEVVVELLEEVRAPMSKREIEAKLDDLRLLPDGAWWPSVTKQLKLHPRVVVAGGRYSLRRTD